MYTPPYLPQVPFSVAYMNLCEWRDAQVASENWLVGTPLMFIHASEASEFLPVAEGHPVLLERIRHRGTGGHRDVSVATLVERVPAPYGAGPARRGGQCS